MNIDIQTFFVQAVYFVGALLFILGLRRMSAPSTSNRGLTWIGIGLLMTFLVTYFHYDINQNYLLMTVAIVIGGAFAFVTAKNVALTDMSQMIALYNAMGAGSAAAIAAVVLIKQNQMGDTVKTLVIAGALFGAISSAGSFIAFLKLKGIISGVMRFPMQSWINSFVLVVAITFGVSIVLNGVNYEMGEVAVFYLLAFVFGVFLSMSIEDTDTPIVISLFNALTGLAVGFVGYVLSNPAMVVGGIVVASAGILLTKRMARVTNRSISKVVFGAFSDEADDFDDASEFSQNIKTIENTDVAVMMAFAEKVIIVPGYGMAVAQAQHKLWEMTKLLKERNVDVRFAIHPVAGRMPGHMNVLLSEAGVPYDEINDIDEINDEFSTTDVVLVVGGNDVVNPAARTEQNSPIYGMPILNADYAKNVVVVKRGSGLGFSGIENDLFFSNNTRLLYGDGLSVLNGLIKNIKEL